MRVCIVSGTIDENCLKCKCVLHLLLAAGDDLESISSMARRSRYGSGLQLQVGLLMRNIEHGWCVSYL